MLADCEGTTLEFVLRNGFRDCEACGLLAGRIHQTSRRLWQNRLDGALAAGGTDPLSGVTAAGARAHLALIVAA